MNRGLGETVNYTYCNDGNLYQVSSGTFNYATFNCVDAPGQPGYNASGQPGTITFGNSANTTLTYNPLTNRLNTLTTTAPGSGTVQNLSYNPYDLNGNIQAITDTNNSNNSQNFIYDGINRLTTASSSSYNTLTPTYDAAGNIQTFYDSGNTANRSSQNITYDLDNRVSSIAGTYFAYNYQGMRVRKTTTPTETIYIENLYEVTNGGATKHIFAGDRRIASKTASDTYYYHPDHLGSLSVLTNSAGNMAETVTYFPFGETRTHSGTIDLAYKFTGQELDPETGLYYYKSRYYDPAIGRFISADQMLPVNMGSDQINYNHLLNKVISNPCFFGLEH